VFAFFFMQFHFFQLVLLLKLGDSIEKVLKFHFFVMSQKGKTNEWLNDGTKRIKTTDTISERRTPDGRRPDDYMTSARIEESGYGLTDRESHAHSFAETRAALIR
jgi:hypothetical protein